MRCAQLAPEGVKTCLPRLPTVGIEQFQAYAIGILVPGDSEKNLVGIVMDEGHLKN